MRNANWYFLIEKHHMKPVHLSMHMNLYHADVLWQHFERKSTLYHLIVAIFSSWQNLMTFIRSTVLDTIFQDDELLELITFIHCH